MKHLWLKASLLGLLVASAAAAQSHLPQCAPDHSDPWNDCEGTLTANNGNKYNGEFRDNKMNGQGTFTWPNGTQYMGNFSDGKMSGQGTLTWADGSKYVGEFSDGNMSGQGTVFAADGTASSVRAMSVPAPQAKPQPKVKSDSLSANALRRRQTD